MATVTSPIADRPRSTADASQLDSPPPVDGGEAADSPAAAAKSARGSRLFRLQIGATLVGGTLLLCSVAAQFLWEKDFYAALPAALAMLMLGAPLAWAALQDLLKGEAGMNALVALAVIGDGWR